MVVISDSLLTQALEFAPPGAEPEKLRKQLQELLQATAVAVARNMAVNGGMNLPLRELMEVLAKRRNARVTDGDGVDLFEFCEDDLQDLIADVVDFAYGGATLEDLAKDRCNKT